MGPSKLVVTDKNFDSSSDLKINLGILPISLLFDCRAATYSHSIMNKNEVCLLKLSFKITNSKFFNTIELKKSFTQTNSICNLHEKSIIKKGILRHNSLPGNYLLMSYSQSCKKQNISSFFLMNIRRTRRQANMVQLLGNL